MENQLLVNGKVKIPNNVFDYLKLHTTRLLNSSPDNLSIIIKGLFNLSEDKELNQTDMSVVYTLLHLLQEKKDDYGIFSVIYGGKSDKYDFVSEDENQINNIYTDIRIFTEIPEIESTLELTNATGEAVLIRGICDFILDGERVLVGNVASLNNIAFFKVDFDDNGYASLDFISDKERLKVINTLWHAIKTTHEIEGYENNYYENNGLLI